MKKLSGFDLGCIIAFVVIGLLGAGVWYYLSGQLDTTKQEVSAAASEFEKYSKRQPYLPNQASEKILQANIDLLQAQLDPLVKTKLQAPGNKLSGVEKEDTVAWKHDLDAEVSRLNSAAKVHVVTVPDQFYWGFSRYLNQNPTEEQTTVLSKQLLGVEEIANIFINSSVRAIATFRRTYEEDADSGRSGGGKTDPDFLPGNADLAPGGVYIAYPFEIEFDTTTDNLRRVVNGLAKSPYVFVIRTLTIRNSSVTSPQVNDLQKLAGSPPVGVLDSSPGATSAAPKSAPRGPQFLFGNETLHIKARIDMIEWKGPAEATTSGAAPTGHGNHGGHGSAGGHAGASRGGDE